MVFKLIGVAEVYVQCPECGMEFNTNKSPGQRVKCPACDHEDAIGE